jgi:hypothetical protein
MHFLHQQFLSEKFWHIKHPDTTISDYYFTSNIAVKNMATKYAEK